MPRPFTEKNIANAACPVKTAPRFWSSASCRLLRSPTDTAEQRFSDSGIKNFELALWEEWNAAVKKHWRDNPATDAEIRWQGVSDKCKARYLSGENISAAYGTTLICAVSIGSQILIEQIGDGSSVVLQRNGEFKIPVPPDAENFANVTTSFCDADACNKFRHAVLNCDENAPFAPAAIFLAPTDSTTAIRF